MLYGILVRKNWLDGKNKTEWPLTDDARKNCDIFRYNKRSRVQTKADFLLIKTYDNNLAALDTQIVLYTLQLQNFLLIWNYVRKSISYQLLNNLQSNHGIMFVGKGKL